MNPSSPQVLAQREPLGALFFVLLVVLTTGAAGAVAIDVVTTADLGFGRIVATSSSGTVTVSPAGVRSATGGAVLGNGLGVSAASFAVTGDANTSYSITLPASAQLTAGGNDMTADGFTSSPDGSGNLGAGGAQTITLGATLHVGASQPASSYSGTYFVTVSYN